MRGAPPRTTGARGAASTAGFKAPEFRNRPKSASAARRKKREELKEAVNITRRPASAGSSRPVTPVIGKPLLNAQKMRDYGRRHSPVVALRPYGLSV